MLEESVSLREERVVVIMVVVRLTLHDWPDDTNTTAAACYKPSRQEM